MGKKAASQKWGHSDAAVKRFSAAMQQARDRAPEDERWELGADLSHEDMAHAALVAYDIMASLLPRYGRHPTRDVKLYQEVHGDISNKPTTAVVDTGANGVLVSMRTAQ